MTTVYVGIGSNIARHKHVEVAIRELRALDENLRISTIYECEAVGFESQPFYNLVVEMKTSLDLTEFSRQLRDIEFKWGRAVDAGKLEPRTVDLDIILFGEQVSKSKPELPRSDIFKFAFVLQPLLELCPQLVVPNDGRTIEQIGQQLQLKLSLSPVPQWFT